MHNPLYPNGPLILVLRFDPRIPVCAQGYVDDLGAQYACPAAVADATKMLARYVPEIESMIADYSPALRIYNSAGLPTSWVIENETTGELFIVPAMSDGWAKRTPYRGHREALETIPGYNFMGLGVPLRRPWTEVSHDPEGRN